MKIAILIPSSEGKTSGGSLDPLKQLHIASEKILANLKSHEGPLEKLYGVKEKALAQAIKSNASILSEKTLPAIERYSGVVYDGIDYATLKNKELFDDRVLICSSLFGLICPKARIPEYKLKIDKLDCAKIWKEYNAKRLRGRYVIDLLPQSHKKAVFWKEGIEVEFVLIKNGKKMPAGHQGKHIKGRFIRFLIENDIASSERFSEFNEEGYEWNGSAFIKNI